jgi:hypothetical protein
MTAFAFPFADAQGRLCAGTCETEQDGRDPDALRPVGLDLREAVLDLVVLARITEGLVAAPFGAHDIEELAGAGIALVLVVERIAILPQLGGVAAGDDVERDAPARELVKHRELPCQERWRRKPRSLRDQHVEPISDGQHVLADLQTDRNDAR